MEFRAAILNSLKQYQSWNGEFHPTPKIQNFKHLVWNPLESEENAYFKILPRNETVFWRSLFWPSKLSWKKMLAQFCWPSTTLWQEWKVKLEPFFFFPTFVLAWGTSPLFSCRSPHFLYTCQQRFFFSVIIHEMSFFLDYLAIVGWWFSSFFSAKLYLFVPKAKKNEKKKQQKRMFNYS